ncbi:hypothetical protein BN948_01748 [Hydrogenophaga intermedia]|uniref:Uncharacterized protein n=1 Tax=Hydrogenophaga intermedia TaxID=65786 RepID=A0A1L1PBH1_HYDIT|nr:hypothetical protein [Hydrogenophaga intermedia]CDN87328.1 hypothetical protein BN948_01748 [Hydrogenophaga intermedia]
MAKPIIVDAFAIDLGNTIDPEVVLPEDVPAGANVVAIFLGGTNDSDLNVVAISSDFSGSFVQQELASSYEGYGICAATAALSAFGPGRTLSVDWNVAPPYGPYCVAVFLKVDDPADFAAAAGLGRLAGTNVSANPSNANDLVLAAHIVYGDTAPALPAGGTNVYVSPGPIRDTLMRVSVVPTVMPTTTVTMPAGDYAAMAVLPLKDKGGVSDTTPPTLTSPTGTKTGSSTATGTVSTNEANGTAYAVVTTSATAPTAAQVRAGQDHTGAAAAWAGNQAVGSTGVKTFNATGLAGSTTFRYHFHQRDAANNDSAVVTSAAFTTDAPADTTPPTLSSPTGAATGTTTASGSVSTNEANGTLYRVTTTNATESAATVKAGASQAVTTTGVQNMGATGLTPGTTYRHHYLHRDAAGNDSAVVSSAPFATTSSDTTAPILSAGSAVVESNALIVVGATTDEGNGTMYLVLTSSSTPPSATQVRNGQDHTGAAAALAANQAIGSAGAKSFNATGLASLTGYYPYLVHRDAAGNDSSVLAIGLRTTFRDGATGQYILDNTGPVGGAPAGILFNDVDAGDEDKWFSFRIVTPPVNDEDFDIDPQGRFTYTGPSADFFEYQLEVDGVDVGSPVRVDLYDEGHVATPANSVSGSTSTASSATQVQKAEPAGSVSGSTSSAPSATQVQQATPAGSVSGSTSTASSATQVHQVTPANSVSGSTSTSNTATHPPEPSEGGHRTGVSIALRISL